MSDFEKKNVLQQITFWTEIDLYEKRFWWMICLQKINFRPFYPAKMPTYSVMRFLKNHDWEKKRKKTVFESRLSKKEQILKQVFNNASDFESRISKYVRFSVNFKQLVFFGIGNFCSMSNFEKSFLPHVRFWSEILGTQQIFTWNWIWKRNFSWTVCFQIIFQNLSEFTPTLSNSSVFGSELLQRVTFRIKLISFCRFLLWLSALRQNLSQDFYNASDFDEKTVFRNLKLLEQLLPKKCFHSKKKNWIKNFEYNRSLNHFLYNASCFESIFQTRQT